MATHPDWKQLDGQVTVAPQIHLDDIADIAAAGYRVVMCNRPDGETAGQPDWADVARACAQHGVTAEYVPQSDRDPTGYAVARFGAVMRETAGKVFAYCRSGTRCEILWTAAKAKAAQGT